MLGTGARYAEYGITGGFFLFAQALILWFARPQMLVSGVNSVDAALFASVDKIPLVVQPAIQSLLVALTLLSVFIIGLVLEIVGSIVVIFEAGRFRKHLVTNQWIAKFIEAEMPNYAEDYRSFLDVPRFWQLKKQLRGGYYGILWQWQMQQLFRRLEFALIARVLASGAKTEMLAEQTSICRMSRAIAIALYLAALDLYFLQLWHPVSTPQGPMIPLLLLVSAYLIPLGAYSRFANMLFSLVYVSWKPQNAHSRESAGGE